MLKITSTIPIKNILFGNASRSTVGFLGGIILTNLANGKTIITQSSAYYDRGVATALQTRIDPTKGGVAFPLGLMVSNLTPGKLGMSTVKPETDVRGRTIGIPFNITIVT
jgi:hypothetical protein